MSPLLNTVGFGGLVLAGVSKSLAVGFYDSLIRRQFEDHHESWKADGSHRGMNWRPPTWSGSFFGQSRAWSEWLFNTPEWAKSDKRALGTLFRFRVAESGTAAGIVVIVLAVIVGRFL
jgi:hypothetical protein